MCVAELNASLHSCNHRWYHLVRPCTPGSSLHSCASGKLALEGWEIKCDFCPFCADWQVDGSNFRLVGSESRSRSRSRTPSLTTSLTSARRDSRRGSLARTDSTSSFTTIASLVIGSPITQVTSERNKAQNMRIDSYIEQLPEHIVKTGRRPGSAWNTFGDNGDEYGEGGSRPGNRRSDSSDNKSSSIVMKSAKRARKFTRDFQSFFR